MPIRVTLSCVLKSLASATPSEVSTGYSVPMPSNFTLYSSESSSLHVAHQLRDDTNHHILDHPVCLGVKGRLSGSNQLFLHEQHAFSL